MPQGSYWINSPVKGKHWPSLGAPQARQWAGQLAPVLWAPAGIALVSQALHAVLETCTFQSRDKTTLLQQSVWEIFRGAYPGVWEPFYCCSHQQKMDNFIKVVVWTFFFLQNFSLEQLQLFQVPIISREAVCEARHSHNLLGHPCFWCQSAGSLHVSLVLITPKWSNSSGS